MLLLFCYDHSRRRGGPQLGTPLHYGALGSHTDVCALLLAESADQTIEDSLGRLPKLVCAFIYVHVTVLRPEENFVFPNC